MENFTAIENRTILSADGTVIGFKKTGNGPGLIIVHGAGRMANDYDQLAGALADTFTVYTYDRRGRGASGQIGEGHCLDKECDDLISLLHETGAEIVFGHSMGGLIVLEAASRMSIPNIAVYEPPVPFDKTMPIEFIDRYSAAVDKGQYERAMAVSLKGLEMHEAAKLPEWLLVLIIKFMRVAKGLNRSAWRKRMAETLPTLLTDIAMIRQLGTCFEQYKKIRSLTLLMAGSKSPSYLLQPIDKLKALIPYSSKEIFEGFYHVAPEENADTISLALKNFFN